MQRTLNSVWEIPEQDKDPWFVIVTACWELILELTHRLDSGRNNTWIKQPRTRVVSFHPGYAIWSNHFDRLESIRSSSSRSSRNKEATTGVERAEAFVKTTSTSTPTIQPTKPINPTQQPSSFVTFWRSRGFWPTATKKKPNHYREIFKVWSFNWTSILILSSWGQLLALPGPSAID